MTRAIFLCDEESTVRRVYGKTALSLLKDAYEMTPHVYQKNEILADPAAFANVEAIFSTWGMPSFSEEEIRKAFPSLKAVFYGAGTVQRFARPFLACGVKVFSAWAANAVPVAEYTVSQILLANKGFFLSSNLYGKGDVEGGRAISKGYPGNYAVTVGLIGAGMIGSLVAKMLRSFEMQVLVFDPFLSDERAEELGVTKTSLESVFEGSQVVSNHLANNAQTQGMIRREHFASMRPYATFINTGRGAQVVEEDLVAVLRERPDLCAILDVTYPEPPVKGHPFYALENCILTPHIAGSSGNEVERMAIYVIKEALCLLRGEKTQYEVTLKMLETMA